MSSTLLPMVFFIVLLGGLWPGSGLGQEQKSLYDATLAKSLGGDDYGMKNYVLVVLLTGDSQISDAQQRSDLFRGHFANMTRLAKEKVLVMAGPLTDAEPKRGIFIYNVATLAEAEALVNTDPAVKAGIFKYELSKLYSSAALMKVGEIHEKIQKLSIE